MKCEHCGKCCYRVHLRIDEYKKLIKQFPEEMKQAVFTGTGYIFPERCPFLKQNKCSIYKNRFKTCRVFPIFEIYLDLSALKSRLGVASYCPARYSITDKDIKKARLWNDYAVQKQLAINEEYGYAMEDVKKSSDFVESIPYCQPYFDDLADPIFEDEKEQKLFEDWLKSKNYRITHEDLKEFFDSLR